MSEAATKSGNAMEGRLANGRYAPGKAFGRKKGSLNKRRQTAQDIFDKYNFDPLEKKIILCRTLANKITSNHFKDAYEKIEYLKLYAETLKDVLQYGYQKLKAVEHFGQIEILQKLQNIEQASDEELAALLAEAEELAHAHS